MISKLTRFDQKEAHFFEVYEVKLKKSELESRLNIFDKPWTKKTEEVKNMANGENFIRNEKSSVVNIFSKIVSKQLKKDRI